MTGRRECREGGVIGYRHGPLTLTNDPRGINERYRFGFHANWQTLDRLLSLSSSTKLGGLDICLRAFIIVCPKKPKTFFCFWILPLDYCTSVRKFVSYKLELRCEKACRRLSELNTLLWASTFCTRIAIWLCKQGLLGGWLFYNFENWSFPFQAFLSLCIPVPLWSLW